MHLRLPLALIGACASAALAGCEPNQLYLVSHTVIGVNGAVSPDQTSGYLVIGYDRTFATVMPRSVKSKDKNDDPEARDAMTALACSSLSVKGISVKRYTESIATGKAAHKFAKHLADKTTDTDPSKSVAAQMALKDFFDCFKDQTPDKSNP
jgi:hypothetical protein